MHLTLEKKEWPEKDHCERMEYHRRCRGVVLRALKVLEWRQERTGRENDRTWQLCRDRRPRPVAILRLGGLAITLNRARDGRRWTKRGIPRSTGGGDHHSVHQSANEIKKLSLGLFEVEKDPSRKYNPERRNGKGCSGL